MAETVAGVFAVFKSVSFLISTIIEWGNKIQGIALVTIERTS
jgi:hypothetical protein